MPIAIVSAHTFFQSQHFTKSVSLLLEYFPILAFVFLSSFLCVTHLLSYVLLLHMVHSSIAYYSDQAGLGRSSSEQRYRREV